jgi:hypothetical protein
MTQPPDVESLMPASPRRWAFNLGLGAVLLALVGYWTPWLTHPAAALRLSGYDLAEWTTHLPGVLDGSLPLSRLSFLIPLACLALLLALAGARLHHADDALRRGWRRYMPASPAALGFLALALACALLVLPPYEAFRNAEYWPEYQTQFALACATLLGLAACQVVPDWLDAGLQVVFALLGSGCGAWALLTLKPAADDVLNAPWAVGLGWMAMLLGLAAVAVTAGIEVAFALRRRASYMPASTAGS